MIQDHAALRDEAIRHLQALIRIDTTNPPGNEAPAIEYLARLLAEEGIPHDLHESAPGRLNLTARLGPAPSAERPDDREALLLHGHLDVVAAEPDHWTYPPFEGRLDGDCVWGRGALDMKGIVVMQLMALLTLARSGARLTRPLKIAWVADEEEGSRFGMGWLARNQPDALRARVALGEVGGYSVPLPSGGSVYLIGTGEKGIAWLRVTVDGPPGHGSITQLRREDNAVALLAAGLDRLHRRGLRHRVVEATEAFLEGYAELLGPPTAWALRALRTPRLARTLLRRVIPDPSKARVLHAMLHDTATPTILDAGTGRSDFDRRGKPNVIPSDASVILDGRTLPGTSTADMVDQVQAHFGPRAQIEVLFAKEAQSVPVRGPFFDAMAAAIQREDPGVPVLPHLIVGFTDAKYIAPLGAQCYGYAPMKLPREVDFSRLIHGHDERIPVETLTFGCRVLTDLVQRVVVAGEGW